MDENITENVRRELFALADEKYKLFNQKLIPTVNPERVIGIRTHVLRKYAVKFAATEDAGEFLRILPHYYYEENNLHAFIIERIKNLDTALEKTQLFLPYIDNWATCDSFMPEVFRKNPDKILPHAMKLIDSDKTYTVRYGIGIMMGLFLSDKFDVEQAVKKSKIKYDEYYINMMTAWYFATALAKKYNDIIPFIKEKRLPVWVHNKTIQKAVESYRIDPETKEYLKSLKIR